MIEADVLIIGKGVAACAMALALKKKGIKNILIAGRDPLPDENISETLPLAAYELLCRLGMQHVVEKYPVSTGIISKWTDGETLVRESVFEVFESSWQLDKAAFVRDFHDHVVKHAISCITVTHLQALSDYHNSQWQLQFKNGETEFCVKASFVVDASGRSGVFARKLGAKRVMFDQQVAVTGVFRDHQTRGNKISSFIESLPDGWCYSALSHTDNRFVTLFSDADIVKDLKLNKKQQWLEYLNKSELFCSMADNRNLARLSVCPADSFFVEPAAGPGWLAIGNACYSIDPLTSGGLFHALYTALSSAEYLARYLDGEINIFREFKESNRLHFEDYLDQRLLIYRSVTRFAAGKYWQRRHERIFLNPKQLIQCRTPVEEFSKVTALNSYLSASEWEELYALCNIRTPAQNVVANFSKLRPAIPARRIIRALQFLMECELLV